MVKCSPKVYLMGQPEWIIKKLSAIDDAVFEDVNVQRLSVTDTKATAVIDAKQPANIMDHLEKVGDLSYAQSGEGSVTIEWEMPGLC